MNRGDILRQLVRKVLMLNPGYRKASFLEQEFYAKCEELKAAIEAVKPVNRTDEIKAAIEASKPVDRTDEIKAAIEAVKPVDRTDEIKAAIEASKPVDRTDEIKAAIEAVKPVDRTDEIKAAIEASKPVDRTDEIKAAIEAAKPVDRTDELKLVLDAVKGALFKNDIRCRWQVLDAFDGLLYPPETPVKCLICGHEASKASYETKTSECIFGGGRLERFVCPKCGCIFGPLKMMSLSTAQLNEEYTQHYSVYCEGDSTWKERLAFESLKPTKNGRYLNFGAGAWSKTTEELRQEGWDVWDYDPNAPRCDVDWLIRSPQQLATMKFDGIFSNDVLEHFKNPLKELADMKAILSPGGKMVHCTGCYEYDCHYTRFHYIFYTGRSLEYIAEKLEMAIVLGERINPDDSCRLCYFSTR